MHPLNARLLLFAFLLALGSSPARALTALSSFSPGGTLCGAGFAPADETVWVYTCSAATVVPYTTAGSALPSVPRPGESANDVDVEVAPTALTLGTTPISAGTLLFINGETGVAEIYALSGTGSVLATLTTGFGVSHVVGGAYHPTRGTFFLVQDGVPGGTAANRIAEIDPVTGAVLNSFQTSTHGFAVNYGDIEVHAGTGNLFVVSNSESTILELTPLGGLVQEIALPAGVSSLSGIGFDEEFGEAWVSGTGGTVWRLGGFPLPEPDRALLLSSGVAALLVLRRRAPRGA